MFKLFSHLDAWDCMANGNLWLLAIYIYDHSIRVMYVVKHRWKVYWTNLQLKECNNLEIHQFPTLKWVKRELSKWKIKLKDEINVAGRYMSPVHASIRICVNRWYQVVPLLTSIPIQYLHKFMEILWNYLYINRNFMNIIVLWPIMYH